MEITCDVILTCLFPTGQTLFVSKIKPKLKTNFGLILLTNKVGPVGNRHVKITSHVISMLHIHIVIFVIQLYQYM